MRDPDKRRHMARELSVLYRTTHDGPAIPSPTAAVGAGAGTQEAQSPSGAAAPTAPSVGREGEGEGGQEEGRRHVVSLYDAFANMSEGTVALMVEYMDGGSLQDVVDAVSRVVI